MAKKMNRMTLFFLLMTVVSVVWYGNTKAAPALPLAITFGTTAYHLVMRLMVGSAVNLLLHNHVDYRRRWFRVGMAEQRLYKKLRVKQWKGKMATYDPSCFDSKLHSWDEIAQAMCQAELVHEVIIVFSFLPVFEAIPFGALPVFVITSVLAACLDAMFVVIQRYNRPRIIKLIEHSGRNKLKSVVPNDNHS